MKTGLISTRKTLLRLFFAKELSNFGSLLSSVICAYWIHDLTGSIMKTSVAFMFSHIGGVVFSLYVASIVDRNSFKRLAVVSETTLFVLYMCIAYLAYIKCRNVYFVYVLQILISMSSSVDGAAGNAWIAHSVKDDIEKTYSKILSISSFNRFVFILVAGYLASKINYWMVFTFDGLTYLAAALICSGTMDIKGEAVRKKDRFVNDILDCARFLYGYRKHLLGLSVLYLISNMILVPLGTYLPLLVKVGFDKTPYFYSLLLLAMSLGGLCATIYYRSSRLISISPFTIYLAGLLIQAVVTVCTGYTDNAFFLFPQVFLISMSLSLVNINYQIEIRKSSLSYYARTSTILESLSGMLVPVGYLVLGNISENWGIRKAYLYSGYFLVLFFLTAILVILTFLLTSRTRKEVMYVYKKI